MRLGAKAFILLLVAAGAVLYGCSAQRTDEAWTHAYEHHAELVKATAADQRAILYEDGTASCIIPGVVFWPYKSGPWIARVNRAAAHADLRAGDRILEVNGRTVRHLGVLLFKLSRLRTGELLELTVDRHYELRRLTVRCADSTAVFKATASLLEAAADGDWTRCLNLATTLPAIARVNYSWAAQLRYDCNEALRLSAHREPNAADATLAHQWARLRLEEAKDIPQAVDQVRWSITDMIYWLRRHHFDYLAADLADHLDAYSPELW